MRVKVMKEIGTDISGSQSKGFEHLPYNKFDYVVTMGCQEVCPYFPAKEKIDWQIDDPKGKPLGEFQKIRDEIGLKVKELIEPIAH